MLNLLILFSPEIFKLLVIKESSLLKWFQDSTSSADHSVYSKLECCSALRVADLKARCEVVCELLIMNHVLLKSDANTLGSRLRVVASEVGLSLPSLTFVVTLCGHCQTAQARIHFHTCWIIYRYSSQIFRGHITRE